MRLSGGAFALFGVAVTGVVLLADTEVDVVREVPFVRPSEALMMRFACVEPMPSFVGSMFTLTVVPSGGSGPVDGTTVMKSRSVVTVNEPIAIALTLPEAMKPGMKRSC